MSNQPAPISSPATCNLAPTSTERHNELQKMVMYADPLHMGRHSVWLIAQYSLLAVVAAAFSSLPANLIGVLAALGVIVSILWLMTARDLTKRIDWLTRLSHICASQKLFSAVARRKRGKSALRG